MGIACPCPILQYDASNRIMLQLCAAGRAVCVILAARFAAVRARRYRSAFPPACRAAQPAFACLASTCAIFSSISSLVTSAPRCRSYTSLPISLYSASHSVFRSKICRLMRVASARSFAFFAGYACRMTGDLAGLIRHVLYLIEKRLHFHIHSLSLLPTECLRFRSHGNIA